MLPSSCKQQKDESERDDVVRYLADNPSVLRSLPCGSPYFLLCCDVPDDPVSAGCYATFFLEPCFNLHQVSPTQCIRLSFWALM